MKIKQLFKAVVELQQWLVLSQKMVRRFVTYKSDVVDDWEQFFES